MDGTTPFGVLRAAAPTIYPHPVQTVFGTPAVVFRDHRWTLPVLFAAAGEGRLDIPATLVTFDRHKDALAPLDREGNLGAFARREPGSLDELLILVKYSLSPRDDDWITAGMELGLIGDAVQFGSREDDDKGPYVTAYEDSRGLLHRLFHLGGPAAEMSYKGALACDGHETFADGLWDILGWTPDRPGSPSFGRRCLVDFDLDFFTFSWRRYTMPFTPEIYAGEFFTPCQSTHYDDLMPADFIRSLAVNAGAVSLALEPRFCGGPSKAKTILADVCGRLFEETIDPAAIDVDAPPDYPTE